jgi:hypothetical protein
MDAISPRCEFVMERAGTVNPLYELENNVKVDVSLRRRIRDEVEIKPEKTLSATPNSRSRPGLMTALSKNRNTITRRGSPSRKHFPVENSDDVLQAVMMFRSICFEARRWDGRGIWLWEIDSGPVFTSSA